MLTDRQKKILTILQKHPDSMTSEDIARLVGVSSKTIRTDLKSIAAQLPQTAAKLIVSTRKGCWMEITDAAEFEKLLHARKSSAADADSRNRHIMQRLLYGAVNGVPVKQQELADELYIGLSTLKMNLKDVKSDLQKYRLDIVNYKNQGMMIAGDEAQIRYCISEYIFRGQGSKVQEREDEINRRLFSEYDLALVKKILLKVLSSYEMVLGDVAVSNLLTHVLIALKRADRENNVVYTLSESKNIEKHREFLIASSVFEEIYKQLHIDVATSEIYYLAQHLIASKKYTSEQTDSGIDALVGDMLKRVKSVAGIDFSGDANLYKWLTVHLQSVIPRIRFQMNIRNEILDVIKNEYPLAFQIGVIASKVIEEKEHITVSENEIGYIAVHFGAALSRMDIRNEQMTKSALIVCGSGIGTAVLLKARLLEFFKNLINVIDVVPGYRLRDMDLSSVDFIFTTIPLEDLLTVDNEIKRKIIQIKHLLNKQEIENIQHLFFHAPSISKMNVGRFFHRDQFITGRQFDDKEAVLTFLTGKLKNSGLMDEEACRSVFEREASSPTEIGNLVAIPHPMINNTAVSSISVLVLNKPIMWVEHHVQVVFLISIAKSEFYLWEPIFLKLFKYLVKENGVKKIIDKPVYEKFIRDFTKEFN